MEFKTRLKRLRERLGLTQAEMGDKLWVSGNYILMLEKGDKNPSPKLLQRVELLETGQNLIEVSKSKVSNSRDSHTSHESDLEWLQKNGYREELILVAQALRRAAEKRKTDQTDPDISLISDAEKEAAIRAAEDQLEDDIAAGLVPNLEADVPKAHKSLPSQRASRQTNQRKVEPSEDRKKLHN